MRTFQRNLQNSTENIGKFAANFQKICPKKPGTLNRYGSNELDLHLRGLHLEQLRLQGLDLLARGRLLGRRRHLLPEDVVNLVENILALYYPRSDLKYPVFADRFSENLQQIF